MNLFSYVAKKLD